jgi:hypothetical protein
MTRSGSSHPIVLLIMATCVATGQVGIRTQYNKPDKPITGLPFIADLHVRTVQHLDNGVTITREVTGHMYRSSSGLERTEGTLVSIDSTQRPPTSQAMLVDRVQGTAILLHAGTATIWHNPPNASVTVVFFPPQAGEVVVPTAKTPAPVVSDLGRRLEGNLEVIGSELTQTTPWNGVGNDAPLVATTDTWTAPRLNLIVARTERNPAFGEHAFELSNIREEEPDASLFQIPHSYKILSIPSAIPTPVSPQSR